MLDAVYEGQRDFGFGTAVKAALEADATNLQDDADTIGFRAVSATTPTGYGCCTTMPCRRPTRSIGYWPT